jgi:hypothetical protein
MLKTISAQLKGLQNTVNLVRQEVILVSSKLDAANRRILRLEAMRQEGGRECLRDGEGQEEEGLDRIPEDLRFQTEHLMAFRRDSNNPGQFACQLLRRYFSDLFLTGRKYEYNWFGGGQKAKKELDARKKRALEVYVGHFYPEVKDPAVWRDRVVSRINECLRRPRKGRKEQVQAETAVNQENNDDRPDVDDQQEGDETSSGDIEEEYIGPLHSLVFTDL